MQALPLPSELAFMMQFAEQEACLAWQGVIAAADTDSMRPMSASEVRPAKTTDETMDVRMIAATG
jgi:hypothetical protein